MDVTVSSLMEHYCLLEEDCSKQISDSHLQKISLSCCKKWRFLPACFKMEEIIAEDIDREPKGEDEKRFSFFKQWQQERGSDATYKALISALLEISCRQDAEKVCELLQKSLSTPEQAATADAAPDSEDQHDSSAIITGKKILN